ncbi:hypothetical protein PHSY_001808 [Pseudozyma hubeiensis SY62]|uniref:Uncharacterized protein n=1 Tax=Pseudozyma hubeiensis (strain SY62) TaxID=1305764 RepID=R9NZS0_PSEHS|nr:hypothetical protein PHSY_001808 [Pseudozyma hubeiensis SY62]GAC94237.1 hypothetical protein PHSY_001808 [Pseudozyma hubeiensis SY62]
MQCVVMRDLEAERMSRRAEQPRHQTSSPGRLMDETTWSIGGQLQRRPRNRLSGWTDGQNDGRGRHSGSDGGGWIVVKPKLDRWLLKVRSLLQLLQRSKATRQWVDARNIEIRWTTNEQTLIQSFPSTWMYVLSSFFKTR